MGKQRHPSSSSISLFHIRDAASPLRHPRIGRPPQLWLVVAWHRMGSVWIALSPPALRSSPAPGRQSSACFPRLRSPDACGRAHTRAVTSSKPFGHSRFLRAPPLVCRYAWLAATTRLRLAATASARTMRASRRSSTRTHALWSVGRSTLPFSRTPCRVVTALRMSAVPRGTSRRDDARPAPPRHDSRTGALFQCPPALQFGRNRPLEYPGVPTAPTGAAGRAHSPQCLTPPLR